MKKIFSTIALSVGIASFAQFNIKISAEGKDLTQEAYIYTLDGSKDILFSKEISKNNVWKAKYPKYYTGMLRVYLPEINGNFTFISENKDVDIRLVLEGKKIQEIQYLDLANQTMNDTQTSQEKKEQILPVLHRMKVFYKSSSEFYKAMEKEIAVLSSNKVADFSAFPFVEFYTQNYGKFLQQKSEKSSDYQQQVINFMTKSDDMLETSSLMRPVLTEYLKNAGGNIEPDVDALLKAVDAESPRGQTILSELIEIFDAYGINQLKDKYLNLAKGMKCEINSRLASTLKVNKDTEIGARFPNYTFVKPTNTSAKTLYDVKANKKVVVFWSSTCSHCERDIPQFIEKYQQLKAKGVEIIAFSLDSEKQIYEDKVKIFPWINDSELKGWHSSYGELYNVHATPTYFILDNKDTIIEKPNRISDVFEKLGVK